MHLMILYEEIVLYFLDLELGLFDQNEFFEFLVSLILCSL